MKDSRQHAGALVPGNPAWRVPEWGACDTWHVEPAAMLRPLDREETDGRNG